MPVRSQSQLVTVVENDAKEIFSARRKALPHFWIESVDFFVIFEYGRWVEFCLFECSKEFHSALEYVSNFSESGRLKDRISSLPRTCPGALAEGPELVTWAAGASEEERDYLKASRSIW